MGVGHPGHLHEGRGQGSVFELEVRFIERLIGADAGEQGGQLRGAHAVGVDEGVVGWHEPVDARCAPVYRHRPCEITFKHLHQRIGHNTLHNYINN